MELINADELRKSFDPENTQDWYTPWIIEKINEQPIVEAVPVVYGEWIRHENIILEEGACECSNCHSKTYWRKIDKFNEYYWFNRKYCPECGAHMRKSKIIKKFTTNEILHLPEILCNDCRRKVEMLMDGQIEDVTLCDRCCSKYRTIFKV